MYRIELAPGEETVFRTIEELAIGVRNGLVTARCRIYHNASQKWLPIEFHPHYKKALEIPAARLAEVAASRPAEKPRFDKLTFAVAPSARPGPEKAAEPVDEAAVEPSPVEPMGTKSADAKPVAESAAVEAPAPKRTSLERVQAQRPLVGQSNAEHRVAVRQTAHRVEKVTAQHPVAAEPTTEHTAEQPAAEHPVAEHPVAEHPVAEHLFGEGPFAEHTATQHAVEQPPVAHHPGAPVAAPEHSPADPWPAERSVAERTDTHHAAAERSPVASHAPIAPEPPAPPELEPRPAPGIVPWHRPNSYLPTTVRIVADDPFVAIAPTPAIAPHVEAQPADAAPVTPPWMREAPALELPNISYPEITPAEEPVSERASGSRGRRPLQVAIAVLVLATGGYLARSFYSPVQRGDATTAPAVADRPALPSDAPAPASGRVASTSAASPGATKPLAATPDLSAPASSGFAAALEPRAIASGPLPKLPYAGAGAAPATSADSAAVPAPIAPPPAQVIDVPSLPGGVPLVPTASEKNDSAMKRILRAVTSGKDAKQR